MEKKTDYFISSTRVKGDKFWAMDVAANRFNHCESNRKGRTIVDRTVVGATLNDGRQGFVVGIVHVDRFGDK